MTPITIRVLRPEEWQLHKSMRLAALADAPYAFTTTYESASQRSDEGWDELTRERAAMPNGVTFFAFAGETPCGMAACVVNGELAEMFGVWVAPAQRRLGAGEALVRFARGWAFPRGAARIKVGVYEDNPGALAFYRRLGFADTGEREPIPEKNGRSVLTLIMELGSPPDGRREPESKA